MTEEERREHAIRLIESCNQEYEYSLVYEDEELADASEDDQLAIHKLMYAAKVTASFD